MKTKILLNQICCLECNETIFSRDRHDFVYCKCNKNAVDGGMDYLRRVGNGNYLEQSIVISESLFKKLMEVMDLCEYTNKNSLGIVCAIMRTLQEADLLKEENLDEET